MQRRVMVHPKRSVRLAIALAFVTCCGAAAYLVRSSNRYFDETLNVRLDPAGLSVYAAERRTPSTQANRPVFLFFGDSRALMWDAPNGLPEWTIVDRGIGYQTTAQILLRFDADVSPLRPSIVLLEAGVNDLKAIAAFPDRRAEIVSTCKENLRALVARCRSLGATVILVTVFDLGDIPLVKRPFWSNDVAAAVREVNVEIRKMAAERVIVFESATVLDDDRGKIRPAFQFDYLHISPAGYAALNEQLVPMVHAIRP